MLKKFARAHWDLAVRFVPTTALPIAGKWHVLDGWRSQCWSDAWDSLSWGEGREPSSKNTTQLLYMMGRKRRARNLLVKGKWGISCV